MLVLINAARNGCRESLCQLIVAVQDIVRIRVMRRVDRRDVEDVTQEVLLSICKAIGSFRGSTAAEFDCWLHRIVWSAASEFYRKDSARVDRCVVSDIARTDMDFETVVSCIRDEHDDIETVDAVDLVSTLDPEDVAILWPIYVEDIPIRRIGRSDESWSTTLRRVTKAKTRLREQAAA